MINNTRQNKATHKTFSDSRKPISSLSQEEIKTRISQAIQLYMQCSFTLKELIQLTKGLRENNYDALPQNLKNIIDEISSLSVVNDVLTDIFIELKK